MKRVPSNFMYIGFFLCISLGFLFINPANANIVTSQDSKDFIDLYKDTMQEYKNISATKTSLSPGTVDFNCFEMLEDEAREILINLSELTGNTNLSSDMLDRRDELFANRNLDINLRRSVQVTSNLKSETARALETCPNSAAGRQNGQKLLSIYDRLNTISLTLRNRLAVP